MAIYYQNLRYNGTVPVIKTFGATLDAAVYDGIAIGEETQIAQYTVSLSANDDHYGSVSGGGTYNSGTIITIVATVYTGYHFDGWYDTNNNLVSSNETYTFTLSGNVTLVAVFSVPVTYTLTLSANDSSYGNVSYNGNGTYEAGEEVNVYAFANTGYSFSAWYDTNDLVNPVSTSSTYSFYISANTSLVAYFEADSQQQQICPQCGGTGHIHTEEMCHTCGGTGHIEEFDPETDEPIMVPCPICGGTGTEASTEECPTCGGTGYVSGGSVTTCPDCGGSGMIETEEEVVCPSCGGSGMVDMGEDPETGEPIMEPCPMCGGSGTIEQPVSHECPRCDGTGYVSE